MQGCGLSLRAGARLAEAYRFSICVSSSFIWFRSASTSPMISRVPADAPFGGAHKVSDAADARRWPGFWARWPRRSYDGTRWGGCSPNIHIKGTFGAVSGANTQAIIIRAHVQGKEEVSRKPAVPPPLLGGGLSQNTRSGASPIRCPPRVPPPVPPRSALYLSRPSIGAVLVVLQSIRTKTRPWATHRLV